MILISLYISSLEKYKTIEIHGGQQSPIELLKILESNYNDEDLADFLMSRGNLLKLGNTTGTCVAYFDRGADWSNCGYKMLNELPKSIPSIVFSNNQWK